MRRLLLFLTVSLLTSVVLAAPQVVQVGRFSTVNAVATPAQQDPLVAIASFRFSPSVKTIGQALDQVLANTGYALVAQPSLPSEAQVVLAKPLPITQRELGPLAIQRTLVVLMGVQAFRLVVDPIHRLVSFRVNRHFVLPHTHFKRKHRA